MRRVGIYLRVSTAEQAEKGNSIQVQEEKMLKYIELNNYKFIDSYVDAGISGAKFDRPELKRLIQDVKNDRLDVVLVYKLDRLSRTIKDTMILIEDVLKPNNVALISIQENFDTNTPMGMATIGLLSTFAQLERETIKERMMSGRIQAAKTGQYLNHAPFGYKVVNRKLVKDEEERERTEYIFKELLSGTSLANLVHKLALKGYTTRNGKSWHFHILSRMAKNIHYTGNTMQVEQFTTNTHEAYITVEDQETIKKMIISRKKYTSKANIKEVEIPTIFRGLLRCPNCDNCLAVSRQKSRSKNENNTYYISYRCAKCKRLKIPSYQISFPGAMLVYLLRLLLTSVPNP